SSVWASLWPVLLGIVVVVVAFPPTKKPGRSLPQLPPGDVLLLAEWTGAHLRRGITAAAAALQPRETRALRILQLQLVRARDRLDWILRAEAELASWTV